MIKRILLVLALLIAPVSAWASQNSCVMPTVGTVSGLTLVQDINSCLDTILTASSGAGAPSSPQYGTWWLNTTANALEMYDGTNWIVVAHIDTTNHVWDPPLGGGSSTLTASATTDLGSAASAFITITGNTTISSFGNTAAVGTTRIVVFSGTPTVNYNASTMILPGAQNITVASGDVWFVTYIGGGTWRATAIQQASGQAVVNPSVPLAGMVYYAGFSAPSKFVFGYGQALSRASYPDYVNAVSSTQSVTTVIGTPTVTGFSDTTQFANGQNIEAASLPANTTIVSCSGSSCTVSQNATASIVTNATVFLWGYGSSGNSTTVGVPDCRNVTVAGRGNMGGTSRGLLTSTYFGANPNATGVTGGAQSYNLAISQLPSINLNTYMHDPGHSHTIFSPSGATGGGGVGVTTTSGTGSNTGSAQTGILFDVFGGGQPYSAVPPTVTMNCIVRVLQ